MQKGLTHGLLVTASNQYRYYSHSARAERGNYLTYHGHGKWHSLLPLSSTGLVCVLLRQAALTYNPHYFQASFSIYFISCGKGRDTTAPLYHPWSWSTAIWGILLSAQQRIHSIPQNWAKRTDIHQKKKKKTSPTKGRLRTGSSKMRNSLDSRLHTKVGIYLAKIHNQGL